MDRYEKYKPSGIAWIGEVPEHWELKKIKFCFDVYAGATPKTENPDNWDGDIVWITPADYKTEDKFIKGGQRTITKQGYDSCNTQIVPKGSIVFSKRAPIGSVAISDVELCTNQGCLSCVPKGTNSTYYYYVMSVSTECFDLLGSGATFKEISADSFSNVKLPFPTILEQNAIVAYLDARCSDIDKVVATQEKRIALLKELRQSIITQAVTRGLNPNVKMKDSGDEWIGMVPEHWTVGRLKYFLELLNGRAYLQHELQEEGKYRILRVGNFFTNDQWYYSDMELEPNKYCEKGDLLFAWSASFGPYIWDAEKVIYHYHIWKVNLLRNYDKHYAYYMLMSLSDYKRKDVHGSTMTHITLESMNNAMIPVPSPEEQKAIVKFLDSYCGTIDKQIDAVTKQIGLLKEYKQALITETVTGKRKVC